MGAHVALRDQSDVQPQHFYEVLDRGLKNSLGSRRAYSGIDAEGLSNDSPLKVVLGITDSWEKDERVSTSGAKLYIGNTGPNDAPSRSYALGRAAALLNEEDFDQSPYLEVFYGNK